MDIFGQALLDFSQGNTDFQLWLHNTYGPPEEMPVDVFFRKDTEMPELELLALSCCRGKVLDIGAGVGSHALILQDKAFDITALEISASACQIMKTRGLTKIINTDILQFSGSKFDTLLLLMNGIGLTGDLIGLIHFLHHAKTLLNPGGELIFDSSDILYLYDDVPLPADKYYGEMAYRYEYKAQPGNWFKWLYVDADLLRNIASEAGWQMELLFEDGMDQFLVRLKPIN